MTCARRPAGARTPASPTSAGSQRPDARTGRARARRLTVLLPVLALLAGAFSLFAPASAQAQTTPVWSATLTTFTSTNYDDSIAKWDNFRGCANGYAGRKCLNTNGLTDDDFTHGGTTYTIIELGLAFGTTAHGQDDFLVRFSGLTGTAAKTALTGLTLNVGSTAYAISDATVDGNLLTWASSLGWTSSTGNVAVSLTQAQTTTPTQSTDATLSGLTATQATSASGPFTSLGIGTFASGTTTYTASVGNSVTHVKLTPTVNESNATV